MCCRSFDASLRSQPQTAPDAPLEKIWGQNPRNAVLESCFPWTPTTPQTCKCMSNAARTHATRFLHFDISIAIPSSLCQVAKLDEPRCVSSMKQNKKKVRLIISLKYRCTVPLGLPCLCMIHRTTVSRTIRSPCYPELSPVHSAGDG